MNTKVLMGAFIVVVVVLGGYFFLGGAGGFTGANATSTPAATNASSTAPAGLKPGEFPLPGSATSGTAGTPGMVEGAPVKTTTHITLAFDQATFTSTSSYPVLSGTASNLSSAQVLIEDSTGKGLVASEVAIANGRWSYSLPVALAPGTYAAFIGTKDFDVKATVIVKAN